MTLVSLTEPTLESSDSENPQISQLSRILSMRNGLDADHPVYRLASAGASALSNWELISLLIEEKQIGSTRVLETIRSLRSMARCDLSEIVSLSGLSAEQAAKLVAAFELGRRAMGETIVRPVVDSPAVVCQLMAHDFQGLSRESMRILLLDTKQRLLAIKEVSIGSLATSHVHCREIFKPALTLNAHSIVLTHNHPSGNPKPSQSDLQCTRQIADIGTSLGVEVADHIIIGEVRGREPTYYSFNEEGLLGWRSKL